MARTTINIDKEVRKALKNSKFHPRETYDDTIKKLLKDFRRKHGTK